jgi:hypothetical protein
VTLHFHFAINLIGFFHAGCQTLSILSLGRFFVSSTSLSEVQERKKKKTGTINIKTCLLIQMINLCKKQLSIYVELVLTRSILLEYSRSQCGYLSRNKEPCQRVMAQNHLSNPFSENKPISLSSGIEPQGLNARVKTRYVKSKHTHLRSHLISLANAFSRNG